MGVFTTQTVAKTTSLFTEQSSGPEIQRLIGEVNGDLQRMTTELDALQRDVQARGGSARSQDADHHKNVVSYLKAQVGETTAAFKDVLQTRTTVCSAFPSKVLFQCSLISQRTKQNLKAQEEKKRSIRATHVPLLGAGERRASNPLYAGTAFAAAPEAEGSADSGSSDVAVEMPGMAMVQASSYHRLRADAVRQIEQSMVQLQGIYTQLAGMVQEQDELLGTIDHNIDAAVLHVDAAHGVLQRQLARVSRNRWLIMQVLGVLFVTVILFFFFFL